VHVAALDAVGRRGLVPAAQRLERGVARRWLWGWWWWRRREANRRWGEELWVCDAEHHVAELFDQRQLRVEASSGRGQDLLRHRDAGVPSHNPPSVVSLAFIHRTSQCKLVGGEAFVVGPDFRHLDKRGICGNADRSPRHVLWDRSPVAPSGLHVNLIHDVVFPQDDSFVKLSAGITACYDILFEESFVLRVKCNEDVLVLSSSGVVP